MKIALILFEGLRFLDFVGFYDVITRLKELEPKNKSVAVFEWDICGITEEVADGLGLTVKVDRIKPDLSDYDMIFIPGGLGTRKLQGNKAFIDWISQAKDAKHKISVCTGSLILGAAGFLENKKATTHPLAYELLEPYCKEVIKTRIVKDGNIITGGGVAASIDLGLYVAEELVGREEVEKIKKKMDYPYTNTDIVVV
jgi:transcriptional regulator GlxA family with amidase domain